MTPSQLLQNMRSIDIVDTTLTIAKENESLIIDLNHEQLRHGKDANNEDMPEYSPRTLVKKKQEGSISNGKYDLYDTGDFYEGFFTEKKTDYLKVSSKDSKLSKILKITSGYKIFGLIKENMSELLREVKPELIKRLNEKLKRS